MTLAELVAEQHDVVAARFVDAVRGLPETAGLPRIELLDSIAFFIDDLVEALAAGGRISPRRSAAASHGVERLAVGFRIDQMVREYTVLARLILELAEEHGVSPTLQELQTLVTAIGDGAATGAAEYTRRREAELLARENAHMGFLAHELRNTLTSGRFAFDLLRRRNFLDGDELVRVVESSMRQSARLVDDALSGVRVRSGAVTRVHVHIGLLVREIAAELQPQAAAKQIDIAVDAPERLAASADPHLVRSALNNVIHNAVKFTPPGGTIGITGRARGGDILVDVEDSCGGIDLDTIKRMFAPFVQAGSDRSGHGLGLAIARQAAEAQGGSLSCQSVEGKGCIMTLSLPVAD